MRPVGLFDGIGGAFGILVFGDWRMSVPAAS